MIFFIYFIFCKHIGFLFSSLESVIDLLPGKKLQMAKDLYENNKEAR